MKITQDEVVDNQTTLHIELEDADLATYLDMGYRRIADRVAIPGFRRGKAPRRIVEQAVGRDQLLSEVLDSMAYETTDKAIAQSDLDAAGPPKIDRIDMQDEVRITAIVPLSPEVRLGDYRSTRIEFESEEVTEEQIADQLERIRQSLGTWETVERPAEFGDLITMTGRGVVEEEDLWIFSVGGQSMYLAEDGANPVPGFPAEIVGAGSGAHLDFELEVPEIYPRAPSAAGKRASFSVDILDVMERTLPDLDDDLARGLPDGFENMEALRTEIRAALGRAADERADAQYRELVVASLVDGSELALPPVLIEREADRILSEQYGFLESNNIRREDYLASIGKTEDEFRQEAEYEAERRVARSLTLARVAEIEDVEADESEITERFNLVYAGARLRRRERRDRREGVARTLRLEKAVEALVAIAKGETQTADDESENPTGGEPQAADGESESENPTGGESS